MSPLMEIIFEELRENGLNHYIDAASQDVYDLELARLLGALTAVLPESCHGLLQQYDIISNARALVTQEALFQATFAAARQLG